MVPRPRLLTRLLARVGWLPGDLEALVAASFRNAYPRNRLLGMRVRAWEQHRTVVAVFYRESNLLSSRPAPYRLFAVEGNEAVELECSPSSPYWIRGRK
jgi:hypothetical protein